MTRKGLMLLCLLIVGCVSNVTDNGTSRLIEGDVTMLVPLSKTANVELSLLAVVEGKVLTVGKMRYRLDMLPLTFSMRLGSLQFSHEDLFLRTRLHWDGERAIQAKSQQWIVAGKKVIVQLSPLPCYPECL
ncbi:MULTISPECIES: YscW family type III secretion system pilotin [Photorhabdus]|uniref:Lipoprotein virg (Yscw) (Virg) n=2 Tax=Photorhabdus asymbiotica TaxID=291112 RepID=C7BPG9_PHOAA|nr:YscW family type III secretion system pilotin [Photorhabdus asymbiotica]RKS66874.1 type III secretion system chaperone YscW [Photorhabdus asymbiotica]CAQ83159.1 lipoprotein virg (yscw) (virg) [Photorhabdus asymbiotica]